MSVRALMAMKAPLAKKRTVSRYFYGGKGYSNRGNLYRKLAKGLLLDMVLGESRQYSPDIPDDVTDDTPEDVVAQKMREAMDARFAKHFPHEPGCTRAHGGCRGWEPRQGIDEGDAHHDFQSCRYAQTKWIEAKAKELRAYDDSLTDRGKQQEETR